MITQLDQVLLAAYKAPVGERAIVKQVPIAELEHFKQIFRDLGISVRIRYRGPRHDRGMRLTTLKRDAERFTVYPK